jgi:hypothetical protein
MRLFSHALFISSVLAFCPQPGPSLPPPALRNSVTDKLIPDLSFESLDFNADISYTIKATIGSKQIFRYAHVAPAYNPARKDIDNTKIRIGSVSKVFTALAVLLSSDKIGWEDSIKKHVPKLEGEVWDKVTISALAGHTSGIGKFVRCGYKD